MSRLASSVLGTPETSGALHEGIPFAAAGISQRRNPGNLSGFSPEDEMCSLIFAIDGTATSGVLTNFKLEDPTDVDSYLDAIIDNISFESTDLGRLIPDISLSQLVRGEQWAFGIMPQGLPKLGKDQALAAAGTLPISLRIEVPYALPQFPGIGHGGSPFLKYFEDGGLQFRFGGGTFADAGGNTWTVQATTKVTTRIYTQRGRPVVNKSPLTRGFFRSNTLNQNVLSAGTHWALSQLTTNVTTLAANTSGAGHVISVDGMVIQRLAQEDPRTRANTVANGFPDRGSQIRAQYAQFVGATANREDSIANQKGCAIYSPSAFGDAGEAIEAENRIVVEKGDLYPTNSVFYYVFQPASKNRADRDCRPEDMVSVPLPNRTGATNSSGMRKGQVSAIKASKA